MHGNVVTAGCSPARLGLGTATKKNPHTHNSPSIKLQLTGSWHLIFGRRLSVPATLELDVSGAELFDVFAVVEPRRVAEVDPETDLHFVALHRVEDEFRGVAKLQGDLAVIPEKGARGSSFSLGLERGKGLN